MRHGKAHRKLGRTASHRRALLKHLVTALIVSPKGRIRTTLEKAKEARPVAEKLISLGKRDDLHARRLALARLDSAPAVKRLFADVAPRFAARAGGYTRILKAGNRPGDNARMALLELVETEAPAAAEAGDKGGAAKSKSAEGGGEKSSAKKADKDAKPAKPKKAKAEKAAAG